MRHSRVLSAEEFHALSTSWKLTEQCFASGRLTEWSFAEPQVRGEEQADFWDWLATTGEYFEPALSRPQRERRRERHVEVPTPLRIVGSAGEAEAVVSKSIWRRSRKLQNQNCPTV
jgi:CRISPR/Cas system endoribonuclease Cas6 (RAMP superfamily)